MIPGTKKASHKHRSKAPDGHAYDMRMRLSTKANMAWRVVENGS